MLLGHYSHYSENIMDFKLVPTHETHFTLRTTERIYLDDERMWKLNSLGFRFFRISTTNYYAITGNPSISFTSMKELMAFVKEWGEVVLGADEIVIDDHVR